MVNTGLMYIKSRIVCGDGVGVNLKLVGGRPFSPGRLTGGDLKVKVCTCLACRGANFRCTLYLSLTHITRDPF